MHAHTCHLPAVLSSHSLNTARFMLSVNVRGIGNALKISVSMGPKHVSDNSVYSSPLYAKSLHSWDIQLMWA